MSSKKGEWILAFFLITFSIYCAAIIGESWDEGFHMLQGKTTLEYLFSLGQKNLNQDLYYREIYSPSYWTIQFLIVQIFTSKYQIEATHLINLAMSIGTILGLGKLVKELFNKQVGKITILILFFYPIFFGHAAFNGKDTILAFSHVWITYLLLRYIKYQHNYFKINNYVVLIGLLAAIATGIQIIFLGSLLPIILIILFDVFFYKKLTSDKFSIKRLLKDILKCFFIFYFFIILFWIDAHPNILVLPFKFLFSTFNEGYWTGWPYNLINGVYYFADNTPKSYILKNLSFKSPEYFLFLYLIFFISLIKFKLFFKKTIKNFNYKLFIIIMYLIFPNLILFILPYSIYDGLRLFIWTLPYYCIIPGLTIYFLSKNLNNLFSKIVIIFLSMMFIFFLYEFLKITPYQYTYLNFLSGKKEIRYKKFENDYWAASMEELIENSNLDNTQTILITSCGVPKGRVKKYMKKKKYSKLKFVNPDKADYIIMTNRTTSKVTSPKNISDITNCFDNYPGINIVTVKRNDQALSVIRKIKNY
jgi:hypothetical protein